MDMHVLFLLPIVVLFAEGVTVNGQQSLSLSSLYDRIQRMEAAQTAQDDVISRLTKKLIDQEETIEKQSKTLQQQNEEIVQLKTLIGFKWEKTTQGENKSELQGSRPTKGESASATSVYQKVVKLSMKEEGGEAEGVLHVRSDDFPMETVVEQLNARVTQLGGDVQALKAGRPRSVFTRWGAGSCPSGSSLAYAGTVAGGEYHKTGAAVNFLCATMAPHLSSKTVPYYHAELWGAEYETFDEHFQGDAVCAVCVAPQPATIMVPGTDQCVQGWTRQYQGYLMAGLGNAAAATEFICVDAAMEGHPGSKAHSDDGKLLYYTATHCGSLPCEPYQNGKIVPCTVCSQ